MPPALFRFFYQYKGRRAAKSVLFCGCRHQRPQKNMNAQETLDALDSGQEPHPFSAIWKEFSGLKGKILRRKARKLFYQFEMWKSMLRTTAQAQKKGVPTYKLAPKWSGLDGFEKFRNDMGEPSQEIVDRWKSEVIANDKAYAKAKGKR